MNRPRALVTGGAGFIGSHLVDRLLEEGFGVAVLDDFSRGRKENLARSAGAARVLEADAADVEAVAAAAGPVGQPVDVIFHLAARPSVVESVADPLASSRANLAPTQAVLEAARRLGVPRVVYASSCAVYGDDAPVPVGEETPPRPLSPYALHKRAGELHCALYAELYGVETVALRFFNVYGPRQDPGVEYAAVVPRFVGAALAGETATIYGDGEQTRDFVFVGDVVEANLAAARAPSAAGAVVNVASGKGTSVNELARAVGAAASRSLATRRAPARDGEVRHSLAHVGRAAERLGWRPRVSLEEGLARTLRETRRATRVANGG